MSVISSTRATSLPTSQGNRRRRPAKNFTGFFLTAPAIAALFLTILFPLLWTVWLSFQSFSIGSGPQQFVGLSNYARIVASSQFQTALLQTLGYVGVTLIVELVLGLALAQLLFRTNWRNKALRLIVAIPLMVAPVVAAMAFRFLFSNDYGLVNRGLQLLGLPTPSWLSSPWLARGTVLIDNLWLALPFVVLVLIAGMTAIPEELRESARMDGANAWQIFMRITLPLLRPSILIILVIRLADAFRVFDSIYVLTGGGPANSTDVMSSYLFRTMFTNSDFPGGAATTVIFVVIVGVIAGGMFLLLREREASL